MPFFKKKTQTAQQKAQRAQLNIVIRLACCGYLIFYVIIPLIKDRSEQGNLSPALKIIIIAAFIAITAGIIIMTIIEAVRKWRTGSFKASYYSDDETGTENNTRIEETESDSEEEPGEEYEEDESEDGEYEDDEYEDNDEDGEYEEDEFDAEEE